MSDADPTPKAPKGPSGFFTKKIGGLVVWQYAVILAVMIAFGFWYKSTRNRVSAPIDTALSSDSVTAEPESVGSWAGGDSGGSGGGGGMSYTPGTTVTSNAQWSQNAANALLGQGQDPTVVQSALAKYLAGQSLSIAEQAVVNAALRSNGTPPEGVVPVVTTSPNVNYAPVRGDSLVSIARAFYGDESRWKDIWQMNLTQVENDGKLRQGTTLTLPGNGLKATPSNRSSQSAIPSNHLYTVQFGDTGIQIAERFYGNGGDWDRIYALNKSNIVDQNRLVPGTVLKLP